MTSSDQASQALQGLLQQSGLTTASFPPTSRYSGIDTSTIQNPDGRASRFVRRRFLPQTDRFAVLQEHVVSEGERLDNIAAKYLGDPEAFWRIADANGAMHPDEVTAIIGSRLNITLPEGIPGPSNA